MNERRLFECCLSCGHVQHLQASFSLYEVVTNNLTQVRSGASFVFLRLIWGTARAVEQGIQWDQWDQWTNGPILSGPQVASAS